MAVVTPDEFARWLRRLDGDALTAFVADLYALRGESVVVRDDGAVVLGDGDRVLSPVSGRRWLRRSSVAADADAVVAARPTPTLLRRAARADASVVDPAELRDIALYSLDRRDTERLFREHFDASPVVDAPDPNGSSEPGTALDRVRGSPATGVAVVVVSALVVAALFGPFGLALPSPNDAGGSSPGSEDGLGPATARTEAESFPPGVGPTGVTDPERLAAAHADAVTDRSYRLVVREAGTENLEGDVWDDVWREAAVESPRRFRYVVAGSIRGDESEVEETTSDRGSDPTDSTETAGDDTADPTETAEGDTATATGTATDDDGGLDDDSRLVHYTAYADGRYTYVHDERENETLYRVPVRLDRNGHGPFARRTAAAVERYLDATRTSVTREAESKPASPYHVVATGTPEAFADPENVSHYRAEAWVGPDGFVRTLAVSYAVTDGEETRMVQYYLSYSGVDAVQISPPLWYERARDAADPESPPPMSTPDRTPVNRTVPPTRADEYRTPTTVTESTPTAPRLETDRRSRFTPSAAPQFP